MRDGKLFIFRFSLCVCVFSPQSVRFIFFFFCAVQLHFPGKKKYKRKNKYQKSFFSIYGCYTVNVEAQRPELEPSNEKYDEFTGWFNGHKEGVNHCHPETACFKSKSQQEFVNAKQRFLFKE